MRTRSLRLAIGAAFGLALVAHSETAAADWISLSSSTPPPPGKLDGWTWVFVSGAVAGAVMPQFVAGVGFYDGKQVFSTKAGVALFVPGALLALATTVGGGFVEPDEGAIALTLLGGPLWSMTGVGLGRLISASPHAPWLGGSMGFSSFALIHGIMAQSGLADYRPTAIIQSLWAIAGGTGCVIDAAYSGGVERGVGIGCSVVSGLAAVHGIVRASLGTVSGRPKLAKRALVPAPWITHEITGFTLAGTF